MSTIIERIGDLLSGRLFNTAVEHGRKLGVIYREIKRLQKEQKEIKNMQTKNEKLIMDSANAMTSASAAMNQATSAVSGIVDKYKALQAQTGQGEDISQELDSLTQAQTLLNSSSQAMQDAITAANTATETQTPPIGGPIVHEPMPEIPLSGTTGGTDVPSAPVDAAAPAIDAGEPGTDEQTTPAEQPGTLEPDAQDVEPQTGDASAADSTGVLLEGGNVQANDTPPATVDTQTSGDVVAPPIDPFVSEEVPFNPNASETQTISEPFTEQTTDTQTVPTSDDEGTRGF